MIYLRFETRMTPNVGTGDPKIPQNRFWMHNKASLGAYIHVPGKVNKIYFFKDQISKI